MSQSPACLEIRRNELLKPHTTFKIGGPADYFVSVGTADELRKALAFHKTHKLALLVLGGGSNILVSDAGFRGLVLHTVNRGISVTNEDASTVTLRISAGETWDDVTRHAVEQGWWGIENLSHIPGQAGAALVQNIGAYGQEIGEVFRSAEVIEIQTGSAADLEAGECEMSYRKSIFNTSAKGRFIIFNLTLQLTKAGQPRLEYPGVKMYFDKRGVTEPTLPQIRQAIISIRDAKFPFPKEERGGNAGSFFKNLLLTESEYGTLERHIRKNFRPEVLLRLREVRQKFRRRDGMKIPTAFLMEICGLKGYGIGRAKVNEAQPLILLNQGGATAEDVMRLVQHVRRAIYAKTSMTIMIEPELVGFTQAELTEYLSLK